MVAARRLKRIQMPSHVWHSLGDAGSRIEARSKGTAERRKRASWWLKQDSMAIPVIPDQKRMFFLLEDRSRGIAGPRS